jgi:peroxiredoxin
MQQIVDLQNDPTFQSPDVTLISLGTDPLPRLASAAQEWNITTPLLSDADGSVSQAYGVLQWATPSGEPGHTFVLIGDDGSVKWIRDYGAPQNGGLMYVPVDELTREISQPLTAP